MLHDEAQAEEVVTALISLARVKDTAGRNSSSSSSASSSSSSKSNEDAEAEESASSSAAGNHSYAIEKAVVAIGHVCTQYSSPRLRACDELIRLITGHTKTLEDTHFAVGETLANIGLAASLTEESKGLGPPDSKRMKTERKDDQSSSSSKSNSSVDEPLFETLFKKLFLLLDDARPKVRGAAAVCFLCFIKYAHGNSSIQKHIFDLQAAATRLLGERSEFVQEVAGKIMSLVYEFADASQRKQLLGSLSHTLGTGKRSAVNESKIDSVGPNGPAGAQLSQAGSDTYQQMCRAANDMGNRG